jgi:hypothetical protein
VAHTVLLIGGTINNGTSSFKVLAGTHCWILYDVAYCGVSDNLQPKLARSRNGALSNGCMTGCQWICMEKDLLDFNTMRSIIKLFKLTNLRNKFSETK